MSPKQGSLSTGIGLMASAGCILSAIFIYLFQPLHELTLKLDLNFLLLMSLLLLPLLITAKNSKAANLSTNIGTALTDPRETTAASELISSEGRFSAAGWDDEGKESPEGTAFHQAWVLENIPESIVILDSSDGLVYANKRAESIYSLEDGDVQGLPLYQSLGMDESLVKIIKQHIDSGQTWQGELTLSVEGRRRTFLNWIAGCENPLGSKKLVIIATDISESVDYRTKAEIANYTRSQFLANISHEIRTPMIGILGSVNLLGQSRLDRQQMENVAVIQECGEHLLSIINDILDVSNIELGLESLTCSPCHLKEVFARIMAIVEPLARDKGLYIAAEIEDSLDQEIVIDHIKLRQILLNLLHNALKFTIQGGIRLTAQIDRHDGEEYLLTTVADTGIGIEKEKFTTIFDPFIQGDSSFSRHFGGTGLGLFVCQKQVELMNGEICLESEEGRGTAFHIRIPIICHETLRPDVIEDPGPASDDDSHSLLAFSPVQVLLVEDNRINRRIVSQMLSSYGFEVTTAQHGLECLRIMQNCSFDVVLMDMQMPVMDGYDATRRICHDPDLNHIPVIAMTAHALAGDRDKCFQSGCSDYIAKPFQTEDLVAVINRNLKSDASSKTSSDLPDEQLLNDLLPEYIESLSENIGYLYHAIDTKDLKAVQNISHDIKGSAGLYGFKRVCELAALIESAAQDHSLHKVRILAANLGHVYEELHNQVS